MVVVVEVVALAVVVGVVARVVLVGQWQEWY